MQSPARSQSRRSVARPPREGFSLVELLVAMSILCVLVGLSTRLLNGVGRASQVRGATDIAASATMSARVEALASGYGALLVIDNGPDPERKLRRLRVLRYTDTPVPNDPLANTVEAGNPILLPQGAFLHPDASSGLTLFSPASSPAGQPTSANEFYYVKLGGNGQLSRPAAVRMVFGPGVMDGAGNLTVPDAMKAGRRGFWLRMNGRPVYLRSEEDVSS